MPQPDHIKIITTGDGSHTLYNEQLNETYHSSHGALAESLHVFIRSGLEARWAQGLEQLSLLEVGFGTGLNAMLTLQAVLEQPGKQVHYTTLEPFPLQPETVAQLNYRELFPEPIRPYFDALHAAPWNQDVDIAPGFVLHKVLGTLQEAPIPAGSIDLVYFDAFAPNKQPEVWEIENLQKCFEACKPGGLLVTYCANGQFKRNLKAAGFTVEPWPGPPMKREMTRGWSPQPI